MLTKKIAAIFLTMLMIFSFAGISVSAATTTQDGLEVSLTTDKTEYTKNEQITATLKVKNTNSEAVSNVTLETVVPTGFKVVDTTSSTKNVGTLNANAEDSLTIKLVKDDSGNSTIEKNNSEDSTIKSPKTGVMTNYAVIILIMAISGVFIVIAFKSKKKIQVLSFVLGVLMISQVLMSSNITVQAQTIGEKISVFTLIKYDDIDVNIESSVIYQNDKSDGNADDTVGEIYYSPVDEKHIKVANDGITMFADNELLVVSKSGVTKSQIEQLASEYNAEIVGFIEKTGDYQWKIESTDINSVIKELKNNELLAEVGYNYIAQLTEENISLADLPGINPGDQYIKSRLAKSFNVGSGMWGHEIIKTRSVWYLMSRLGIPESDYVKVGLIDSQFYHHEDLGFAEIFYETDVDENSTCPEHGTHVAGTMAARGDNTAGICGVYPYANGKLYGVSSNGVYTHNENGSFWVSVMGEKVALSELIFRNVKVINQSQGFNWTQDFKFPDGSTDRLYYVFTQRINPESPLNAHATYQEFVDYLISTNALSNPARQLKSFLDRTLQLGYDYVIVTAAGNDSENGSHYNSRVSSWLTYIEDDNDSSNVYDSYDRIIVVGSVGQQLNISSFSNSGDRVDIYAPGEEILSLKGKKDYTELQGTSMASPHVAGVAADMFTVNKALTGAQIKSLIKESVLDESQDDYPVIDALSAVIKATTEEGLNSNSIDLTNGAIEGWVFDNTTGSDEYDEETWVGLPNCTIEVRREGESDVIQTTTTDSNGHYELVLPNGTYEVKAIESNYGDQTISNVVVYDCQITYAEWIVYNNHFSGTITQIPGQEPIHHYSSRSEWAWTEYDHPDFDTPEGYDKHIIIDDSNIRMYGYLVEPYKDFLFVSGENSKKKVLEFDIQRDQTSGKDSENNWHSMNGGGFLFNTSIDEENDRINGYYVLVTERGLELFRVEDMSFENFRNSDNYGTRLDQFEFNNRFAEHHIKLEITNDAVSLWDGEEKIIDNYDLPTKYGNGFGPITTHKSHDCEQRSYFTFSNITMQTM